MMKSFDRHPYLKHSTVEDMTFKPAHKEASVDVTTAPGQVRHEEQGHKTLSEYIRSIKRAEAFDTVAQEKKLTFDEWYSTYAHRTPVSFSDPTVEFMIDAWNAALKHGKL